MMNRRKIGRLTAIVSVPLLVGASYLALKNNYKKEDVAVETRPQSRPANNLYIERRKIENEKRFQNWLNDLKKKGEKIEDWADEAIKNIGTETDPDLSYRAILDDMIEHLGYKHLRSNVSSLDEAQLICLGEIHKLCGNEEDFILSDKFVGEYDKILVEASPPCTINFPEMKKERDNIEAKLKEAEKKKNERALEILRSYKKSETRKRPLGEIPDYGIFDEDFGLYIKDLNESSKHLNFLLHEDGKENSFFNALAQENKGIVIAADAPREIKIAHVYSIVERTCLLLYNSTIESGKKPHEFLEWVAYEASKAAPKEIPDLAKIELIKKYISCLPSNEEHMKRRDNYISDNIVSEVKSNLSGRRVWSIFGADHLNKTLFDKLESNGISYIAFTPIEEKVAADSKSRELILSGKVGEQHESEYLETVIFPWYVQEKIADGISPYKGDFKNILLKK